MNMRDSVLLEQIIYKKSMPLKSLHDKEALRKEFLKSFSHASV